MGWEWLEMSFEMPENTILKKSKTWHPAFRELFLQNSD